MRIKRFYAAGFARRHMWAKHRVRWEEVVDIMDQELPPRRVGTRAEERRYTVRGKTTGGRHLRIIFAWEEPDTARVITAYPD